MKRYTLTSTDAPDKRPDIATEKGRDKYVEQLDALHAVFVRRVAEGRGLPEEKISSDFGKGGMLIAEEAMRVGMIDSVCNQARSLTPAQAGITLLQEEQQMTLQELLSSDPAAKAEYDRNISAAKAEGQDAGVASMQATIKKVSPYLANENYPEIVGKTALSVLNGEAQAMELTSMVAAVDAVTQQAASKAAAEGTVDTRGEGKAPEKKADGLISSADDLEAAVAAAKKEA